MNKQLTTKEIEALVGRSANMSRAEKLLRWARIVRGSKTDFIIFHNLEYLTPERLADPRYTYHACSAFSAAANDPILKDAGLKGNTAADAMKFFELSQHELHEFSCDCGGAISNADMADRIERLAHSRPYAGRIVNGIRT